MSVSACLSYVYLLAYLNKSSAVTEMGDRLATMDMGRKVGADVLPFGGAAPPLPSGILIHSAVWPQQTWTENWRAVPILRERSWVRR